MLVSGALFTTGVLRYGAGRFRETFINGEGVDIEIGPWYETLFKWIIPVEVVGLIGWWFWVAIQADPDFWWHPLRMESVGTCLFQWGLAVLIFLLLNRWIAERTLGER